MSETLLSVGIDLGTTTTQMIVSRLLVENMADPFSIPRMEISKREILYKSRIHFTPLLSSDVIDAERIRAIIEQEYTAAGISPSDIQTGAVIITGETARKENAAEVLAALSGFAGEFVVATAGPALESVLAARGAGADKLAKQEGRYVLHFDIGGGTSNLALFDPDGKLVDTGCLNVGGRLMKFSSDGSVVYVSPVLKGMDTSDPHSVAETLVSVLEEAAGLRPETSLLQRFITDKAIQLPQAQPNFSCSGGVADLIGKQEPDWLRFGDLGVLLGQAIGKSRLCESAYHLGEETIRATVVGAGTYSTELSGSTVFCENMDFPMHDLPVICADGMDSSTIRAKLRIYEQETPAISLKGEFVPSFQSVSDMADRLSEAVEPLEKPLVVVLEADMAKALGQALRLRLGETAAIICLDGIRVPEDSYLDLAKPVADGAAFPVVVKTLAFL